jgi:hypothetical protein
MEDITEIPQSLLWALCDRALFASAFQAAIDFELIVLQWAVSQGYPDVIRTTRRGKKIYPSLKGAVDHLKKEGHLSKSLFQQLDAARKTRNDLMHRFAWKSLLLGPEQSKDCILYEAHATLKAAWFAVHDEYCRSSL